MSSSVLRTVIQPKSAIKAAPPALEVERPVEDMELVLGVLVENAPVCMAMFDQQMRYMLANRQWVEEFGLQGVQPLIGRSQYEVFPGLHPGWRQVYDRALQGHVVRSEHDALAGPDGRRIVYRWEVRPWRRKRDASVGGLMVTCEKFGNAASLEILQATTESAANEREQTKPEIISACALPMMSLDAKGVVQQANDSAVALCLARGIQEGRSSFWELVAGEADASAIRQRVLEAIERLMHSEQSKSEALELPASRNGHGWDGWPMRWLLTPAKPKGDERRFTLIALSASSSDAPAHPAAARLPSIAGAVAAIAQLPSAENAAPAIEVRRLQDDLARARQELRMLREAEKTFSQRDSRLRQYLEALPCGILVLDELGAPVFQNEQLSRLLGRPIHKDETVEHWLAAACPNAEHREQVAGIWRDDVWRRQLTRTVSLATADGLLKELEFQPISTAGGGVLISIQDATEKCRHEEQLRSIEAKFRTLLHDSPTAIVLMDKAGAIFEVNALAEELLGHPKNELRRYPLDAWLEPDSAIARRDAVRRLRAENLRSAAVPVQIRQGNGQAVPARVQVAQVLNADGEPHCVVHFFEKAPTTPLTPPPAARAHATAPSPSPPKHRTKAEAGASQEPVLVPLVRTNVNGRVREWSERATELFGIAAEVAQGQPLHLYFRPSDATAFYADLARLAAQEEAAHELSFFDSQKQRQFCKINVRASGGGGNDFELAECTQTHEEEEAPQDEEIASSPDLMTNSHASPLAPEQWWPLADLPREKLLLSETHHRIKNHLQIISSLLNLECNAITDDAARAALRSSQNRVRAIAELHQHLYQVALGTMESFTQFAEGLVLRLRECYQIPEERVAVNLELQSVEIQPEWLMPLALTLNEALSNCFEHAFPMDRAGVVQVRLQLQANQGEMLVTDNGTGFPSDFVAAEATGLGLKILAVFAEQMRGQLLVGPSESGGSEIQLRFPIAHIDI